MALKRAVLCGVEERHPYQMAPEALERSADGGPTHLPIQNPGYGPAIQYFNVYKRVAPCWLDFNRKGLLCCWDITSNTWENLREQITIIFLVEKQIVGFLQFVGVKVKSILPVNINNYLQYECYGEPRQSFAVPGHRVWTTLSWYLLTTHRMHRVLHHVFHAPLTQAL